MSHAPQDEQNIEQMQDPQSGFRKHLERMSELVRDGGSFSGHEKNCAFLNTGGDWFATVSGISGFDYADDARSTALVDWDRDGDVDVWIANRTSPQIRFLRNDMPRAGNYLELLLEGDGSTSNRDAVGARVEVITPGDNDRGKLHSIKTVHAGEGFLSQSSRWLHFGVGELKEVEAVRVVWPGGKEERFEGIEINRRQRLVQHAGRAEVLEPEKPGIALAEGELVPAQQQEGQRILLSALLPAPPLRYSSFEGEENELQIGTGKPVLVNVWASWCRPCLAELGQWTSEFEELKAEGLQVYALSVDAIDDNTDFGAEQAQQAVRRMGLPFGSGVLTQEHYRRLQQMHNWPFGRRIPMPAPTTFLFDGSGNLAIIYRGPVEPKQLLADLELLDLTDDERLSAALPYPGRWITYPRMLRPIQLAIQLMERGDVADAADYVRRNRDLLYPHREFVLLATWLGDEFSKRDMMVDALSFYGQAIQRDPSNLTLMNNLAWQLAVNRNASVRRPAEAIQWAERAAAATEHKNPAVLDTLAVAYASDGRFEEAVQVANRARALANSAGNSELEAEMGRRAEQFSRRVPYVED